MNETTKEPEVSGAVEKAAPETWGEVTNTWAQELESGATWN